MIEKFLDRYELKARIAPGVILVLPLLVDTFYLAPMLSSWPIFAASGICSLALVYGMSHVVREHGKAIEQNLWVQWGGPPSTRFMRHRDSTFGTDLKLSIQHALVNRFSVRFPTSDEETKYPDQADRTIVDAFRQVRQYLRQHDPDGLWFKHDIEYGYCRNLLGCRLLWTAIALGATVFAVVYGAKAGAGLLNLASAMGGLSLFCAVYLVWLILPGATKRAAEAYAESAWMAFLGGAEEKKRGREPDQA